MTSQIQTTFLHRVRIRNYKSIAGCDVRLCPLTFLIGPNGSGKSNLLDALSFVSDSLNSSLDHSLRSRGGINDVRRRSHGRPNHFSIRLDLTVDGSTCHYAFTIGAKKGGGFEVQDEECRIRESESLEHAYFRVKKGSIVETSLSLAPATLGDRLYLVRLSGDPAFRKVYDALSQMTFYSLNPDIIREIQPADEGQRLHSNGANLASVFAQLSQQAKDRIIAYLAAIVPGIEDVCSRTLAGNETLEFKQKTEEDKPAQPFFANCMSDGTLRALGILVALFQGDRKSVGRVPLVGIEEPEMALHPAASGVLFDVLREGAQERQVLVTSHSPELLDNDEISADELLSVNLRSGSTAVAGIDEAGRSTLREKLFTPGELLRINQLSPDEDSITKQGILEQDLFDL